MNVTKATASKSYEVEVAPGKDGGYSVSAYEVTAPGVRKAGLVDNDHAATRWGARRLARRMVLALNPEIEIFHL